MITLRLLGGLSIEQSDARLSGAAAQRRRLALLALLACRRSATLSRDKLLGWLWPDSTAERARHLLSNDVYALRQALGQDVLLGAGDALRLNADVIRVDARDFRDALDRGEHERAVELYGGPFLDGFVLPDSPEFEQWVDSERKQFAQLYAQALETLAEQREAEQDFVRAAAWWRRAAAQDPLNSRVTLHLMQALAAAGDPAGALQQARVHETLLRAELDIAPHPEIAAYVEALQADGREMRPTRGARTSDEPPPPSRPVPAGQQAQPDVVESGSPPPSPSQPGGTDARTVPAPDARPFHRRLSRRALMVAAVVLMLAAAVLLADRARDGGTADPPDIRSLAVLPLENCTPDPGGSGGPDPEQEFFAAGLTDALITELAQIDGMRVISRASVMRYKAACGSASQRRASLPEIARGLQVDAVVEGTVVRASDRIRINAQLIRTATDEHVWAAAMERDFRDVLTLQNDIVNAIAASIRSQTGQRSSDVAVHRPVDPEAYTLYLRGRYLWNEHQLARHREALALFEQALRIDSTFAPAYSGVADIFVHLDEFTGRPERGAHQRGIIAARRALELDDELAEAHASLGHLLMHEERWDEAAHEYRRAIELEPSNGNARILYAFFLAAWERHDEAIRNAVRALDVDPLASRTHSFAGFTLYFARRYTEAIAQWQRLIQLYPESHGAYFNIAASHALEGRHAEGLNWAREGLALAGNTPHARVHMARIMGLAGQTAEGERILQDALREASPEDLDPLSVAGAYAALDRADETFDWFERAREGNHGWLMFLRVEPVYDAVRDDPRFAAWIRRMRLE